MFCPICKSEYKDEFSHCAECDVDLVAELPVEFEKMKRVLQTSNQTLLTAFESALTAAGIPHFIRGAEAASLMPINATVVVPEEHQDAATAILVEAEQGHTMSEPAGE
jgi:hypothetical protein